MPTIEYSCIIGRIEEFSFSTNVQHLDLLAFSVKHLGLILFIENSNAVKNAPAWSLKYMRILSSSSRAGVQGLKVMTQILIQAQHKDKGTDSHIMKVR